MFSRIDINNFQNVFLEWINYISKATSGEIIAIDGETVRGSRDSGIPHSAIHIVSAFAAKRNIFSQLCNMVMTACILLRHVISTRALKLL